MTSNSGLFSSFSSWRGSDTNGLTYSYPRYLENKLTYFRKRGDGSVGSRTTIFHARTMTIFSLESHLWSSMYFAAERNSIRTISLLLLRHSYQRKTRIPSAELTKKNWSCIWTIPCLIRGARSKNISPEKRQERPFSLFPRFVTVWLLVLRLCQRATNHGPERLGR
jgi:hypothetical protein